MMMMVMMVPKPMIQSVFLKTHPRNITLLGCIGILMMMMMMMIMMMMIMMMMMMMRMMMILP